MEGRPHRRLAGSTYSRDEAAIATAAALFTFLLATKISLLLWHLFIKGSRPLADIPRDGVLYLAGWDLLLCLGVAIVCYVLHLIEPRGRGWHIAGTLLRGAFCAAIIVFSVASFQVARIYGEPLDIELLRSADNVMVLRESIWAYLGPMPALLLLYGFVGVPLLARFIAKRLARRERLRMRWQLWGSVAIVCLAFAAMQKVRLARIDTFGVKDNAILFFIKEYSPPYRPIDAPQMISRLETQLDPARRIAGSPKSAIVASGKLQRDFPLSAASAENLNVILIQMESTGALHVDEKSAPNITALEQGGLSFKRHVTTATQTRPASIGLYYSDYMPDLGTTPQLVYGKPMPQPALAEVLKSAGYHTGVFHSGFLDYVELRFLFQDKGMDVLLGAREMMQAGAPLAYSAGVREEQTVSEMCDWIRKNKSEKFFAAYLTEFPHHPYVSMENESEKPFPDDTWLNRYQNSLHYTDRAVGQLISFLKSEGLMDKTLIVI
ncbi:MAG: hypothetical protein QOF78_541, partial [Phycisphaerales bacterium]|nr:hypothetical protein [Phycisphaerales bacterium]